MYGTMIRNAILLATLFIAGLVLAQDDGSGGGLAVGEAGSASADEVLEELRAIHDRLGEIIAGLDGTEAAAGDVTQLERRVASLERQVRASAVRDAQRRLESLRGEYDADGDAEEFAGRVEQIRSDLGESFATPGDAELDEQVLGRELTTNFDALAEMLGSGDDPEEAFRSVESELNRLRQEGLDPMAAAPDEEEGAEDEEDAEDATDEEDEADEEAVDPQILGAQIYATNCAACHQGEGEGVEGVFPPLAGNDFVTGDPEPVIATVMHGRGGMPSFASLSDEEIAAVITHERTSWGNDADAVTREMVEPVRDAGATAGTRVDGEASDEQASDGEDAGGQAADDTDEDASDGQGADGADGEDDEDETGPNYRPGAAN